MLRANLRYCKHTNLIFYLIILHMSCFSKGSSVQKANLITNLFLKQWYSWMLHILVYIFFHSSMHKSKSKVKVSRDYVSCSVLFWWVFLMLVFILFLVWVLSFPQSLPQSLSSLVISSTPFTCVHSASAAAIHQSLSPQYLVSCCFGTAFARILTVILPRATPSSWSLLVPVIKHFDLVFSCLYFLIFSGFVLK